MPPGRFCVLMEPRANLARSPAPVPLPAALRFGHLSIITSKTARPQLAKRCCDFRVLEVAMDHYIDCQHMQDDLGLRSAMAKLNPVTHTQEQPVAHDKEQDWTH